MTWELSVGGDIVDQKICGGNLLHHPRGTVAAPDPNVACIP